MKPSFLPIPPGLGEVMLLRATHGRCRAPDPAVEAVYDKLARRLYVSKDFAKRMTYMIGYSGKVDPWIKHLVNIEIDAIMQETP